MLPAMTAPEDPYAPLSAQGPPAYGVYPGHAVPAHRPPMYGHRELATWMRRVSAWVLDAFIFGFASSLIIDGLGASPRSSRAVELVAGLVIGFLNGAYGQTPGKRIVGIKVLRHEDGKVLGGFMGMVRQIMHLLDVASLLVGYLWPLWDTERQTFADKVMATVVVRV
jgi:uncharacterized RDD family membrane protein YckC